MPNAGPIQNPIRYTTLLCLVTLTLLASSPDLHAHPLSLSEVWATFRSDGVCQIDFLNDLDAVMVGVPGQPLTPEETNRLHAMSAEEKSKRLAGARDYFQRFLRIYFDGKAIKFTVKFPDLDAGVVDADSARNDATALPGQKIQLLGTIPEGAKAFSFRASTVFGQVILKLRSEDGGMEFIQPLGSNETSKPFPFTELATVRQSRLTVFSQFLSLGYTHIIPMGLDHILFVLGLFLLSAHLRPLLWQVTAFTLAHSVTLALSMYGLVSLPPSVIDPLVAISIAFIAVENLFTKELKPWRPAVVFSFGLLHGMGFAGALAEANLPRGERLTALLAFNGGVELGQLTVIALAFVLVGMFRSQIWYRARVVIPASVAIAFVGVYWALQRVLG